VAVLSAELNLVPLPREKGLGLIFFASVDEAMQATAALLDLNPAAIEHVDRVLFDQTIGQMSFAPVRELLRLDDEAIEAFLIVEFYEGVRERLETMRQRNLGLRTYICRDNSEMALVWNLRKAGLSLLTGRKGASKPVPGLEDVAIRPEKLPAFVSELEALLAPLGVACSYYGHAASGLLHVRPVLDLHRAEDIASYRELASVLSHITVRYGGSLAGEHGVGLGRAEFMDEHLGPELIAAMKEIKAIFDPQGRMNPGKIFPGAYHINDDLRWGAGYEIRLPFDPVLAFAAKDDSFVGNLEQCNGCGGCRKDGPTMCPTFRATGEEIMSTRGRANTIRAVLDGRLEGGLSSPALEEALSNCLSCKACTSECPSNVNLSLLKAELMHARQEQEGPTLGERLFSRPDLLGRLGTAFPRLANASLRAPWLRWALERAIGLDARRTLPPYATERFDAWFRRSRKGLEHGVRERVMLWDDCFVRYNEPEIGRAAVAVLESAGFEVVLPHGHACCGRPAFSNGRLTAARRMGEQNLALLRNGDLPIIFLEPSCYSMFAEDYRELKLAGAEEVAKRCFLFEQFVAALVKSEEQAGLFRETLQHVAVHAHCHTKAIADPNVQVEVANAIPGTEARLLDTGCCGMAGAFGMRHEKYELSLKVAEPLVETINALPAGTRVIASGTSCRHQIADLTNARPVHLAQVLAEALQGAVKRGDDVEDATHA
jgi:Fe-S oxidoreductase